MQAKKLEKQRQGDAAENKTVKAAEFIALQVRTLQAVPYCTYIVVVVSFFNDNCCCNCTASI